MFFLLFTRAVTGWRPCALQLGTARTAMRSFGDFGDFVRVSFFGDFGVSFTATVAGRYARRGGPRLSVRGRPLLVPTRGILAYLHLGAANATAT